jgi:hypothetical protein
MYTRPNHTHSLSLSLARIPTHSHHMQSDLCRRKKATKNVLTDSVEMNTMGDKSKLAKNEKQSFKDVQEIKSHLLKIFNKNWPKKFTVQN